jgi:hypothetical protein
MLSCFYRNLIYSVEALMQNPYTPPNNTLDLPVERVLPPHLVRQTSRIVCGFGLFELFAWMVAAYWTDYLYLDLVAIIIAINGTLLNGKSCRSFPWTIFLCLFYPVAITLHSTRIDLTNFANWLPNRHSPFMLLKVLVVMGSMLAAFSLLQCYIYQNRRHPTQ